MINWYHMDSSLPFSPTVRSSDRTVWYNIKFLGGLNAGNAAVAYKTVDGVGKKCWNGR